MHKNNNNNNNTLRYLRKQYLKIMNVISCMYAKSLQSCLTLCDSMNYSPPVSSIHRILQARTLDYIAWSPPWESSKPRDWAHISCFSCIAGRFLLLSHQGNPHMSVYIMFKLYGVIFIFGTFWKCIFNCLFTIFIYNIVILKFERSKNWE